MHIFQNRNSAVYANFRLFSIIFTYTIRYCAQFNTGKRTFEFLSLDWIRYLLCTLKHGRNKNTRYSENKFITYIIINHRTY